MKTASFLTYLKDKCSALPTNGDFVEHSEKEPYFKETWSLISCQEQDVYPLAIDTTAAMRGSVWHNKTARINDLAPKIPQPSISLVVFGFVNRETYPSLCVEA